MSKDRNMLTSCLKTNYNDLSLDKKEVVTDTSIIKEILDLMEKELLDDKLIENHEKLTTEQELALIQEVDLFSTEAFKLGLRLGAEAFLIKEK